MNMPERTADGQPERGRLLRDSVFSLGGALFPAALSLLIVPVMFRRLGAEAFGFWALLSTFTGLALTVDFGLGSTITRTVAAGLRENTLLAPAIRLYAVFAALGAVMLVLSFLRVGTRAALPSETLWRSATYFAAVTLAAEFSAQLAVAILGGRRRFDLINLTIAASAMARAGGIVTLLIAGAKLGHIVAWQMGVAVITSTVLLRLAWLEVGTAALGSPSSLRVPREHIRFTGGSFLATFLGVSVWGSGTILAGLLGGPAVAGTYNAALRLPMALTSLAGRASIAFFPAASHYSGHESAQMIGAGVRITGFALAPAAILFVVFAQQLVAAWLGEASSTAVWIIRLAAGAMLVDALAAFALQTAWGMGRIRTVLRATGMAAGVTVLGGWLLYDVLGAPGLAGALLIGTCVSGTVLATEVARLGETSFGSLVWRAARSYLLPLALCCAAAAGASRAPVAPLASLALGAAAAATAWTVGLALQRMAVGSHAGTSRAFTGRDR